MSSGTFSTATVKLATNYSFHPFKLSWCVIIKTDSKHMGIFYCRINYSLPKLTIMFLYSFKAKFQGIFSLKSVKTMSEKGEDRAYKSVVSHG